VIACPACSAENPDRAKFCNECGASLVAPLPVAEERKVVTTLFCDLVAFTAMSEAADPEDVDRILSEYFARATKVIESHGGTVEKFIGDAVVGVFGVPAVHEDDPERAVRAGLRILEALEGMTRPDGSPLRARVGVNTGEALVRLGVDPSTGRGFLTGDAVNVAARLEAAAPPGAVAVGALTRQLSESAIIYEELQPVVAKGKAEPVLAWRGLRPLARTGLRTSGLTTTPFLGRREELAFLQSAFCDVSESGSGRVVLLVGEPGIGKSRLVLEFARSLDERPEMVRWRLGRCLPYGEGVTFWPLIEIVKEHTGISDSDDVATVESKLAKALPDGEERSWLLQRLRPLLGLEASQAAREENFAAWKRFLESIADSGPAVLVLEDLHWAGEGMLAFVEQLLHEQLKAQLLVVATTRPELLERHQGTLTSAGHEDRPHRLTLRALSQSETDVLVAGLLDRDLAAELGPHIVSAVGGNPLYAEQYARLLLEDGLLVSAGERCHLTPGAELPLPGTVQAVIAARLDTLPLRHKGILCDAAVIGETFWESGVEVVSGQEAAAVHEAIVALAARDFVRPVVTPAIEGESEYLFWHALARDVAYAQLPRKTRARKHEAAAIWLEARLGERAEEFAEILAHHYRTALELARSTGEEQLAESLAAPTISALRGAGERALHLDISAAERYFSAALELAGSDGDERLQILPSWGKALLARGRHREAAAAYEEAIIGLSAAGETRAQALAMCWLGNVLLGLNDPASAVLQASVDLLADDGPSQELVEVLGHYAMGLLIQDDDPRSVLEAADRAIETSRLLALPEPVVALGCRGTARLALGDQAGLDDFEHAVEATRAQGLGIERATLELNRSSLIFSVRGAAAEQVALNEVYGFVRRCGIEAHVFSCRGAQVDSLIKTGDWDEAQTKAAFLVPELEEAEAWWNLLYVRALQALLMARRGDPAEAASFLKWMKTEGLKSEIGWARDYSLVAASAVDLCAGSSQSALTLLEACFATPRACISILEIAPEAVRTAIDGGDGELAARMVRQVEALLHEPRLPLERHVTASMDAAAAEARGEHAAAAAGFAAAAAGWNEFSMPYEEAQALLGRGRCLTALGRAQEAVQPLGQAREIFERLGAKPALDETKEWLAKTR
jgi:class 3 adenylate cyclase/tetratricopeptide (TPR) repeat protein